MWKMKKIHVNIPRKKLQKKQGKREKIDLLRSRLSLLKGKDRALMEMYLENGLSLNKMATFLGVSQTSVARRVKILSRRLTDGPYINCLKNRSKFTRAQILLVRDHFLRGGSVRDIAVQKKMSVYRVRKSLGKIRRILEQCQ